MVCIALNSYFDKIAFSIYHSSIRVKLLFNLDFKYYLNVKIHLNNVNYSIFKRRQKNSVFKKFVLLISVVNFELRITLDVFTCNLLDEEMQEYY